MIRLLIGGSLAHGRKSHSAVRPRRQIHPLKSWEVQSPAIERRNSINADAKESVRARLVERNRAGIHFDKLQEKIFVAHAGETIFLLVRRKSRQVVCFG